MLENEPKKITLSGTIVKEKLLGVSKSAHTSFNLKTKDLTIKLRREGGNPFYDDFFEKYEDKNITVNGFNMGNYFLALEVSEAKNTVAAKVVKKKK